jgi:hypothetical protein
MGEFGGNEIREEEGIVKDTLGGEYKSACE